MLKCGDTFLAPLTSNATEHLWIVVTDPDANGKAVGVNLTTRRSYSETTVVLDKGDHPFITHQSVINYGASLIIDTRAVQAAIDKKPKNFVCKAQESCSPELLKTLQDGMLRSKYVSREIKQRCRTEWEGKQKAANS